MSKLLLCFATLATVTAYAKDKICVSDYDTVENGNAPTDPTVSFFKHSIQTRLVDVTFKVADGSPANRLSVNCET